jgi:hypothetical protein
MVAPATSPALAQAFLALADDGEPPEQRSLARALAAVIAAAVLACATPLASTAPPRGKAPGHPAAVTRFSAADDLWSRA